MLERLTRNWWLLALRGALAILFGILALIWPGITLGALVLLWGAYALVDGAVALFAAVTNSQLQGSDRWWLALQGALGVAAGVVTFVWPGITALVLLFIIGGWALVTGVVEIVAAIQLRREIDNEWLLALGGIVSVLFGLFVLFRPGEGAVAIVWAIGIFAIIFGAMLVGLALRVRSMGPRLSTA